MKLLLCGLVALLFLVPTAGATSLEAKTSPALLGETSTVYLVLRDSNGTSLSGHAADIWINLTRPDGTPALQSAHPQETPAPGVYAINVSLTATGTWGGTATARLDGEATSDAILLRAGPDLNATLGSRLDALQASVAADEANTTGLLSLFQAQVNDTANSVGFLIQRVPDASADLEARLMELNQTLAREDQSQVSGINGALVQQQVLLEIIKYAIILGAGAFVTLLWAILRHIRPRGILTRAVGRVAGPVARLVRYEESNLDAIEAYERRRRGG